jgi:hypothetical protein
MRKTKIEKIIKNRANSSAWWSVRLIIERSRVQIPFGPLQ